MLLRNAVSTLLLVWLTATAASAGPNAGGTLVLHSLDLVYSAGSSYCDIEPLSDCESAVVTLKNSTASQVFGVYAVFSEENDPDLRGVEFGLAYGPGIYIEDFGSCADVESSQDGWPTSGRGTRVAWDVGQTDRIVQVYWLAGYSYGAASTLQLTPHPKTGGHFADGTVIPILDQINDYGTLGFGTPGQGPCPAPAHYFVTPEGGTDFPTIQSAINVAGPGSVIELQDGVYRGDGNRDLNFNDTALVLRSASGNPEVCVVDCEGSRESNRRGLVVLRSHDADARIEGIRIVNGYAGEQFGFASGGGGISLQQASRLTVVNCVIEDCFSEFAGGGVGSAGFNLELQDCVIRNNATGGLSGGGFSADSGRIRIENCRFEGNGHNAWGGGLRFTNCDVEMNDCQIIGNRAFDGGGIVVSNSNAIFNRCTWFQNEGSRGGALFCTRGETVLNQCTLSHNTGFLGSGIYTERKAILRVRNSIISFGIGGEAILCGFKTEVVGSDLYGNSGGDWTSCVEDFNGRFGNISADPLFCDANKQDYTLDAESPCAPRTRERRLRMGAWPVACGLGTEFVTAGMNLLQEMGSTIELPKVAHPLEIIDATPNPFSRRTEIRYTLPDLREPVDGIVVTVFDAVGRRVRQLPDAPNTPGTHRIIWDATRDDGRRVAAGVFYVRIRSANGLGDVVRITLLP